MVLNVIDIGTEALEGTDGDDNRESFTKVNANFADLDLVTITSVTASRAITDADNRKYLRLHNATITLTWPATLVNGHAVTLILTGNSSLTFATSGSPAAFIPASPDPVTNDAGDITVVVVMHQAPGGFIVIAPRDVIPDTVTTIYDAGWPASRPDAVHVHAVGHTSAPAWLTADDVWFEAV